MIERPGDKFTDRKKHSGPPGLPEKKGTNFIASDPSALSPVGWSF